MKEFFEKILEFIRNEPAAFGGVVLGLVQAVLGVIIAFNVVVTPERQQAILGLTTALVSATALVSYMIRGNVTPVNKPKNKDGEDLVPVVGLQNG